MTASGVANANELSLFSWLAIVFSCLTVSASLADNILIHHLDTDMSWLLTVGDRMIAGDRLYVDIWEANPPFSVLLYFPAAWFGHVTGASAEALVVLMAYIWLGACLWLTLYLVRRSRFLNMAEELWLLAAVLGLVLLALPQTFAQREYFAVVGALPIITHIMATNSTSRSYQPSIALLVCIGAVAAMAPLVKPYYVLPIALPYLYVAIARRSWRILFGAEVLAAALICIGYVVIVFVYFPNFLMTVAPLVLEVYSARSWSAVSYNMVFDSPLPWGGTLAVSYWFVARRSQNSELHFIMFLSFIGFFLAFIAMGKGFPYHALPFFVTGGLALVLALISYIRVDQRHEVADRYVVAAIVLFTVGSFAYSSAKTFARNSSAEAVRAALGSSLRGKPITVIASNISAGHPFTRLVEGRWIARDCSDWAGAYAMERLSWMQPSDEHYSELSQIVSDAIHRKKEEIIEGKPQLIILDHNDEPWLKNVLSEASVRDNLMNNYKVVGKEDSMEFLVLNSVTN